MSGPLDDLILDLLEWIGPAPRPYAEVIDAWHTSCPRFPVWEEANDRGWLERCTVPGRGELVSVSVSGRRHLLLHRPPEARAPAPAPAPA